MMAKVTLMMRVGADLDSAQCSEKIKAGERVTVLAERDLVDGTKRGQIAHADSADVPLGWVTLVSRDGMYNIEGYKFEQDEPIEAAGAPAPEPAPAAAPAAAPITSAGGSSSSSSAKAGRTMAVGKILLAGSRKELTELIEKLQPSPELFAFVRQHESMAEFVEEKLAESSPERAPLPLQVGYALIEMVGDRKVSIAECSKRMDKNQDGSCSKSDFRSSMRAPVTSAISFGLGVDVDAPALDAFFEVTFGRGEIAVTRARMTTALKVLKANAQATVKDRAELTAKAAEHRRRAERAKEVVAATQAVEAELIRVRSKWELSMAADAKVGLAMIRRHLKAVDIRNEWNDSNTDKISKREWCSHVRTDLGVEASTIDLEAVFDTFDSNGNGVLDVPELAPMIRRLTEVAMAWQVEQSDEERGLVAQLKKLVKQQKAYQLERDKESGRTPPLPPKGGTPRGGTPHGANPRNATPTGGSMPQWSTPREQALTAASSAAAAAVMAAAALEPRGGGVERSATFKLPGVASSEAALQLSQKHLAASSSNPRQAADWRKPVPFGRPAVAVPPAADAGPAKTRREWRWVPASGWAEKIRESFAHGAQTLRASVASVADRFSHRLSQRLSDLRGSMRGSRGGSLRGSSVRSSTESLGSQRATDRPSLRVSLWGNRHTTRETLVRTGAREEGRGSAIDMVLDRKLSA